MKSPWLLAIGVAAVRAQNPMVYLYGGSGCSGVSYAIENPSCREPAGMPSSFDAKSMKFENVPIGWNIVVFTDNNRQCVMPPGTATWMFWTSAGYASPECHE